MKISSIILAILCMCITMLVIVGTRLWGPADLYEKDQPKTISYTADVVLHDRYSLPRDVIYQPATKPPLYNWISAAVVEITGSWREWALKFPSLAGGVVTGAIIFIFARRIAGNRDGVVLASLATAIWFVFGSDVRHGSVIRLIYLARPDMLQCAFLTAGWLLATVAVGREKSFWIAMGFWACVLGATLTKGPAAIMLPVFAVLLALISRDERMLRLKRLCIPIGLPIVLICACAWLAFAYRQDPQHVRQTILWAEVGARLIDKSPEDISKPFYFTGMWFITKTLPWGALALLGVMVWGLFRVISRYTDMPPERGYMPAVLWLGITLLMLSLPAGKRMDYLLPIYPPAAIMAAYFLTTLVRPVRIEPAMTILPVLFAAMLSWKFLTRFHESISHDSDRAVAFVEQVLKIVKDDSLIVINRGKHPLVTLLGRHQGSFLTPTDLQAATWVIIPAQPLLSAVAVSQPLPKGFETIDARPHERLALYRTGTDGPSLQTLIELQKAAGEWKSSENPYHAPGTVYRDVSP